MAKKDVEEVIAPMGDNDMIPPVTEPKKISGVYTKLMRVQTQLNAPRSNFNSFGKYYYRSTEDILEGVKPLLKAVNATLFVTDDIAFIEGRFYIKATATFVDCDTGDSVSNTAFAREEEQKKGSDSAQLTGATSSYARKYALNGLLLCDDNKDPDTDENKIEGEAREKQRQSKMTNEQKNQEMTQNANNTKITEIEAATLKALMEKKGVKGDNYANTPIKELTGELYTKALAQLNKMPDVKPVETKPEEELPFV